MQHEPAHQQTDSSVIQLPAPTAWPLVLAVGISLVLAGMVTSPYISLLGLVLFIAGSVGWFKDVLPHEVHVPFPVQTQAIVITSSRTTSETLPRGDLHRKVLPVEAFHITTGINGGIAGGIAMIVPATIFSLLRYHSLWYAMNLLAAGGFTSWADASNAFLSQFHLQGLLAALIIHGITSLLVGLLYGAILPMFPRWPILTAGILVPIFFTGILHSVIGILSPILNQRIEWFWFVVSQIAFGLVCGFVVNLQAKVRTAQFQELPFAVRAGIHGQMSEPTPNTEETPVEPHQGDSTK